MIHIFITYRKGSTDKSFDENKLAYCQHYHLKRADLRWAICDFNSDTTARLESRLSR